MGEEENKKEDSITFDTLRTVQRKERDSSALSELPEQFYQKVFSYISSKEEAITQARERGGSFSDKIANQHTKELMNAKEVLDEIVSRRSRKILIMAWESASAETVVDTAMLASAEHKLFDESFDATKKFSDSLFSVEKAPSERETLKNEPSKLKIKLLQPLPVFVGADMKSYGPFKEGDMAELPPENVKMLLSKGKAEKIR